MATAVGAGFDIDALLNSITKADKALSNLMSNNEEASKSVINAFQKMSSQGVVPYTQELEKQLNLYKRVDAAITTTFGTAKTGFEGMKSDIVSATDSLNKMIETLKRTDEFKQNANFTRQAQEMRDRAMSRNLGKDWNISAEDVLGTNEQRAANAKAWREAMVQIYTEMFDGIKRQEDDFRTYEQAKFDESLSSYKALKDAKLREAKELHEQQQREYNEMFANLKKQEEDFANYEKAKFNESLTNWKANREEKARVEAEGHIRTQREYEQMFARLDEIQRQNQNARQNSQEYATDYQKQLSMYERMFDELEKAENEQKERVKKRVESETKAKEIENKRQKDDKLKQLSDEIKAYQEYQQRMAKIRENSLRDSENSLRDYEKELRKVKELEAIQEKTLTLASTTKNKDKISQATQLYEDIDSEIKLREERIKSIEEKYAVETELIRRDISRKERTKTIDEEIRMEEEKMRRIREVNASAKQSSVTAKDNYNETLRMYEQMFINIAEREKKARKEASDYEARLYQDNLAKYKKNKEDQAKVDRHYHAQRQKEYEEMFKAIERTQQRERALQNARGDSSKGALNYYNRLYSDKGVMSINNMNTALQKLRDAQNKLNLSTDDGKKKHAELGAAIKRIERDMRQYSRTADDIKNKHTNLINTGDQLKRALTGIFSVSAIKGYMDKLIDVRGEFELQHKSLQVLIQDVDKANKLWDKTVALAINSPFRVKDLVTYTKQLAAYRVETDKLYDKTKMLADVSAGLGVDMNRLILAYGQVKAANFLRGTELRQFTEAGIPMLEKLAEYFSEMENKAVSAADVFERISKRGVSFGDVDAVLERMTSEGGEFYKMQEKQAETLKGMINNLRDSIDLMLSDIGESQEEKLKGVISATKDIVDNWRAIAVAIKQVGLAIAFVGLKQFVIGWKAVTLATFKGTAAMSGASKVAATLRLSLQKLFATMKAHPFLFIAGAVLSAGHALWNYSKALKEVNKKYDEISTAELRRADALNEVKKKVDENNSVIKDSSKSQNEHNEAIKRNEKVLKDLKRDYPDIYSSIILQKDGTVELTNAIEEQNRKLQANIALQQQAKGGFFQESQSENYKDAVEDQSELQSALYKTRAAAMDMGAKLKYAVRQGQLSKEDASGIEEWIEDIKKATTAKEIFDAKWNTPFMTSKLARTLNVDIFNKAVANLSNAYNDYNSSLEDLGDTLDNQMDTFKVELSEINTELGRGTWLQQQLNNLGILDKEIQLWAKDYIEKKVELKITFPEPSKDDPNLKAWQETYNKMFGVKDNIITPNLDESFAGFKEITNEATTQAQEIERLQTEYKSIKELIDAINKAGGIKATGEGGAYEGIDLEKKREELQDVMKQLDFFGAAYEKNSTKENEALQRLKKQISLIREAAKAYDDMRKLHDEAYADEHIMSEYEKAFKEAGLGDISGYAFGTREDELNNLNKLKSSAAQVEDGMLELSKAIAQVGVQIDNVNQELADKKLFDAISDIFSNYEISLEMDKLNIPSDLAEKLFGFESIDLNEIRGKVLEKFGLGSMVGTSNQGIYDSEQFKAMSKERQDELRKSLERESKLQDNALKERLKTYTQYLKKEQDERIKLKLEELRKIHEVEALYKQGKYTQEQYTTITGNIRRESAAQQAKQTWEDFAKTPYIVQMFDDLDKTSNKSLKLLNDQLQTLKTSLYNAGLPASELKEILDKINQVEKELEARNPFAQIGVGLKDLFTGNIDLTAARKAYDEQIKLQKQADEEVLAARERLFVWSEQNGKDNPTYNTLSAQLEDAKKKAYELQKTTDEVTENFENAQRKVLGMAEGLSTVLGYAQQLGSAFGDMADKLGIMSEEEQAILNNAMSVVGDVANIGTAAAQIAANPANPAAWVQGISSVMSLIGNIAATGDAVREKEIQAEMKKIDRLEKAYGKLEKAMEESYNTDLIKANQAALEQNIDAQIKALEAAKAAEEGKKKTDDDAVQQYADDIEELTEKKAELEKEMVETMGGTYDYASVAEQFLDAWLEAFKETGDGLSGLEDNFDEFFSDLAKKQIVYGGLTTIIDNLQKKINADLSDNQRIDNWDDIIDEYNKTITRIDEFLTGAVSNLESAGLDIFRGDGGELSGLSKGLQGMSEETSNILAAYWNAVRFDVSAIRQRFDDFMAMQGMGDEVNPVENHLKTISLNTTAMLRLLEDARGDSEANAIRVKVLNM